MLTMQLDVLLLGDLLLQRVEAAAAQTAFSHNMRDPAVA